MKSSVKNYFVLFCLSVAMITQMGCETTGSGGDGVVDASATDAPPISTTTDTTYRPGAQIKINFADNNGIPPTWEQTVREDGTITLPLGQTIRAADLRKGELEAAIHDLYVPRILRRLTVSVKAEEQSYFVSGEVKTPGQRMHTGAITAMRAIAAAGDFTDFAKKDQIEIFRANGEKVEVNGKKALKDPKNDRPVYPGDRVHVHRRLW
ncbi:MAG TPA: polysaccharide biosynthesis/export family protein [Verrucomicrobiae bacterium]